LNAAWPAADAARPIVICLINATLSIEKVQATPTHLGSHGKQKRLDMNLATKKHKELKMDSAAFELFVLLCG
jgi:hypothetical protein